MLVKFEYGIYIRNSGGVAVPCLQLQGFLDKHVRDDGLSIRALGSPAASTMSFSCFSRCCIQYSPEGIRCWNAAGEDSVLVTERREGHGYATRSGQCKKGLVMSYLLALKSSTGKR